MPRSRYRSRRSSGPLSLADKIIFGIFLCSWIPSFIGAVVYWLLPSTDSPEDHRGFASLIFISPIILYLILFLCVWIFKYSLLLLTVWGPLGTIAWLYARSTPASEHRDNVVCIILGFPFILAFAIFGIAFYGMLAWFGLTLLQNIFYALFWWRVVFRLPRFRWTDDPFAQTQLCEDCKKMLKRSGLLFGRWTFFTKSEELYRYNPRKQILHPSTQPLCHLCLVLSQEYEQVVGATGYRKNQSIYDAFSSLGPLTTCETTDALIRIRTGSWGPLYIERRSWESDCHVQILISEGRSSREFKINTGPLQPLHTSDLFSSTESAAVYGIIKNWLETCKTHQACQASIESSFVPSRLVYVGKQGQSKCRLVEKSDLGGRHVQYFTLSHCWGHDVKVVLKMGNLDSMKSDIDVRKLSKNFRDAISITREVGLEYLWVDSLCIIQDSPEDWSRESILMMDVFANTACTISATASSSSQEGCFRDRSKTSFPCTLVTSKTAQLALTSESRQTPTIQNLFDIKVENAPLMKRAWAFQERLLSRRIIHYCSDTVLFECNTFKASESSPVGSGYEKAPYVNIDGRMYPSSLVTEALSNGASNTTVDQRIVDPKDVELYKDLCQKIAGGSKYEDHTASLGIRGALYTLLSVNTESELTLWEKVEFNQRWFELVNLYSRGALTKSTDKLIAIAGVAEMIAKQSNAQYVVGVWSNVTLEFGLLWYTMEPGLEKPLYRAPSWSWASVDGRIKLLPSVRTNATDVTFHANVQRVFVTSRGKPVEGAASHVDNGYLDISGPTLRVKHSTDLLNTLIPRESIYSDSGRPFNLSFWPDFTQKSTIEQELVLLCVITTKDPEEWASPRIQGLVLHPKKGTGEILPLYERVGVFNIYRGPEEAGGQWLTKWEHQEIRIV